MKQYLDIDPSYNSTVGKRETQEEFIGLKQQVLKRIAYNPFYWVVTLPIRNPKAMPPQPNDFGTEEPLSIPRFDLSQTIELDPSLPRILSTTCTLLAMKPEDHQGKAMQVLTKILAQLEATDAPEEIESILQGLSETDTSLEPRAMIWLRRLATFQLDKYETPVDKQVRRLQEKHHPTPEQRTMAHVQLGEIQALHLLIDYVNIHRPEEAIVKVDDDACLLYTSPSPRD